MAPRTLRLNTKNCPFCDRPQGSAVVARPRYSRTLQRLESIADFSGTIDHCETCGLYFVNPRYDEEEFSLLYKSLSLKTGSLVKRLAATPTGLMMRNWTPSPRWRRALIRASLGWLEPLIQPPLPPDGFRGGRVLDVGCGDGFHLRQYAAMGCETFGTEIHPGYKEILARGPEKITYFIDEFTSIDWDSLGLNGAFDLILFQSVFYRLNDPLSAHRLAWRLLRPGGAIVRIEPVAPDDEAVQFITRFNFPQGFTFIRDPDVYAATLRRETPEATIAWRIFHGRTRKHKLGREMGLLDAIVDIPERLWKGARQSEPWFIRLEITKPRCSESSP